MEQSFYKSNDPSVSHRNNSFGANTVNYHFNQTVRFRAIERFPNGTIERFPWNKAEHC